MDAHAAAILRDEIDPGGFEGGSQLAPGRDDTGVLFRKARAVFLLRAWLSASAAQRPVTEPVETCYRRAARSRNSPKISAPAELVRITRIFAVW